MKRYFPIPQILIDIEKRAAEERKRQTNTEENLQAFLEYEDSLIKE